MSAAYAAYKLYVASVGERILLDPAGAAGTGGEEVCPCMMGFGFMGGGIFGFLLMLIFLIIIVVAVAGAIALIVAIARWAFSSAGMGGGLQRRSEGELREELEFLRREVEALRRRLEEK